MTAFFQDLVAATLVGWKEEVVGGLNKLFRIIVIPTVHRIKVPIKVIAHGLQHRHITVTQS